MIILSFETTLFAAETVNPDKPLHGNWELKPVQVWEADAYGKKVMTACNVTAVADDGTVAVFDWKHWTNFIFDKNGKFVAPFAKRGEGPGEVKSQRDVFAYGNRFIVKDYCKLHYFSRTGKHRKTLRHKYSFGGPRLMIDDHRYISQPDKNKFEFNWVDLRKGTSRTVKEMTFYKRPNFATSEHKGRVTIIIPGVSPDIYFGYHKGKKLLYYGMNNSYDIYIMNPQGFVTGKFSLQREKRLFTREMKKELRQEIGMSDQALKRFPGDLTHFNKIQILGDFVYIWTIYFGDYCDQQQIDIFSLEGKYLYKTVFNPGKEYRIHSNYRYQSIIKDGFLYTVLQNRDDGEEEVVKYRVALPFLKKSISN